MKEEKKIFRDILENITFGYIEVIFPDNEVDFFGDSKSKIRIKLFVKDFSILEELYLKGDIGLGISYIKNHYKTDDLAKFILILSRNRSNLKKLIYGNFFFMIKIKIKNLLKNNNKKNSKKFISFHYDKGNTFYSYWLDKTMTYSSAYFQSKKESLTNGQNNKYDRIIKMLKIKEGQRLLEIGCGWGGFIERLLNKVNFNIDTTGVTISNEQLKYAKKRLKGKNTDLIFVDYRDITGKYDRIVSIEMFEAVGKKYWDQFFKKISNLLKLNGEIVIQNILIKDDLFDQYSKRSDFIREYIFPGGFLPSRRKFVELINTYGFIIRDEFSFGTSYAKTLSIWRKRFNENFHKISNLGYEEKFRRCWEFYLAYCEGGFESGDINVIQWHLKRDV